MGILQGRIGLGNKQDACCVPVQTMYWRRRKGCFFGKRPEPDSDCISMPCSGMDWQSSRFVDGIIVIVFGNDFQRLWRFCLIRKAALTARARPQTDFLGSFSLVSRSWLFFVAAWACLESEPAKGGRRTVSPALMRRKGWQRLPLIRTCPVRIQRCSRGCGRFRRRSSRFISFWPASASSTIKLGEAEGGLVLFGSSRSGNIQIPVFANQAGRGGSPGACVIAVPAGSSDGKMLIEEPCAVFLPWRSFRPCCHICPAARGRARHWQSGG